MVESRDVSVCVVIGGAACLHDDLRRYTGPVDGVVACNDAALQWSGELDAWVTGHPGKMTEQGWRQRRRELGYPDTRRLFCHDRTREPHGDEYEVTTLLLPGQRASGSSGLFAAKVALVDLGFDHAVLCGVPMTPTPHTGTDRDWLDANRFRQRWCKVSPDILSRMSSMSGWTRDFLKGTRE